MTKLIVTILYILANFFMRAIQIGIFLWFWTQLKIEVLYDFQQQTMNWYVNIAFKFVHTLNVASHVSWIWEL